MKEKQVQKRIMQTPAEIEAVALAKMGTGNGRIQKDCPGLTQCQINYRVKKNKDLEGLPKGQGYRTQWRDGTSEIYQQARRQFLPGLMRDTGRNAEHFKNARRAPTA